MKPAISILPAFFVVSVFAFAGCAASKESAKDDTEASDPYMDDIRSRGIAGAAGANAGWASTLEGDENSRPAANVEQLLHGQVAGVEVEELVGGGFRVRIRNASSFLGGTEPLYVIDGMSVLHQDGQGLRWLNIQDVARIEVIKDLSSTAIYGARGANGVVLITTKLGRQENRNP
jgi:TonB-dependent starch-binding outer membrane protein SusC